jgi:hypothetical protein
MPKSQLRNIFPRPDFSSEINREAVRWIQSRLQSGNLKFYDCLEMFKNAVREQNRAAAETYAYYIANIVINSDKIADDISRMDIIRAMREEIEGIPIGLEMNKKN